MRQQISFQPVPPPGPRPYTYKVLARSPATDTLRAVLTVKSATVYTGLMARRIARQLGGHELQAVS